MTQVDADFVTVYTAVMRMYAGMQLWCRSLALAWPWTPDLDMPVILRWGRVGPRTVQRQCVVCQGGQQGRV